MVSSKFYRNVIIIQFQLHIIVPSAYDTEKQKLILKNNIEDVQEEL